MIFIDSNSSKRSKDENGFLIIKDNPIAKAGVFDYLLSEIESDIKEADDEIVKVCRTFDELKKVKDNFANKPIKFTHLWVGDENKQADGAIGSIITADDASEMLKADLIIYNPDLIKAIESGEIVELSPAYTGSVEKTNGRYNGEAYAYLQSIGCINHLAVVERGRSGSDLRINDELSEKSQQKNNKEEETMANFKELKEKLAKKIGTFIDECAVKDEDEKKTADEELETSDEDTLEDEETKEVADNDTEAINDEDEVETADEDEVKTADEDSEEKTEDGEMDELLQKVSELIDMKLAAFAEKQKGEAKQIGDAYNEVAKALGANFEHSGMSRKQIYKFGYETISGTKLADGMDAVTAFKLVSKSSRKIKDSAAPKTSGKSAILEKLKNF